MISATSRLSREQETIGRMVRIYCAARHERIAQDLCDSCREFLDYAELRLQKCPYGNAKPTCANCPVHCYKPGHKARARMIMRFAGPRMLFRHPLLTLSHKMDYWRKARHPRELTREQRAAARRTPAR